MAGHRFNRPARNMTSLLGVIALLAGMMFVAAAPASATDITPVGLTQLKFQTGSFLDINFGLPTAQHFDLGPSTGIACANGDEANDAPPLGAVLPGSGPRDGTDGLWDYYPADNSRSIETGTATGGSATTVVDSTKTWTTNQWAGKSVWLRAGPGSGGAAHIASNTATTLTLTATNTNAPTGYIQGLATGGGGIGAGNAGAGSVYHISLADPECASALDDNELANGVQAHENVVIVATVSAAGVTSIPKTVRTTEAQAQSLGGIYFPPGYIPDASQGMIVAGIQPAPTASVGTPFAGTINIDTGAVSMPINIRVQLQGGSGLTALGTGCYVPSSADANGIVLPLTTGSTGSPPAPNVPITGKPYNTHNGTFTSVANAFSVGGAGNSCAFLNLGASSINTAFGLPAAAGNNTASFKLQTTPPLNFNGPADAGPDQTVHNSALVTLDGRESYNIVSDPIATYAWTQTGGTPVTLSDATVAQPTFTSDVADSVYTFDLTVTTAAASTSTDSVTVTSNYNAVPVANAGVDQTGKVAGTVVTLDGSATDANNDPLTYSWTQTSGPAVTLSSSTVLKPTFTVPPATDADGDVFAFDFTANDGFIGGTNTDAVTVSSVASTPTVTVAKARAGGGTTFFTGDAITLSANITNPDGTAEGDYTYSWTQTGGRTTALSSLTAAHPTYILPPSGVAPGNNAVCTSGAGAVGPTSANCPTYNVVVTKTNTGKSSAAALLANYGSTLPTRPVANAGPDQQKPTGAPTTLTGAASTQANGHPISYAWTQTAGESVTLSDATAQQPTFTTPATPQTLTFSLIVTDTQSGIAGSGTNGNTSLADTVSIVVQPDEVVANAGPDQPGKIAGNVVQLDASGSFEPDSLPLTYTWTQTAGPAVTLSDANIVNPTFTVPPVTLPGGHTFTFEVTATNGVTAAPPDTDTDTVDVTSVASTPVAAVPVKSRSGGTCTNFCTGDLITLSTAITNPDGTAPGDYTYVWSQVSGRTTTLSSTTVANPTYTLPSSGANPTTAACTSGTGATGPTQANCPRFQVIVTKTNTAKVSAAAVMAAHSSTLPTRPVANAGADQTPFTSSLVTLDGTGSTQANGHTISYAWTQTGGTSVTLSDATAAQPTFTAPGSAGALTFSLVVTDTQSPITGSGTNGKTSLADTVTINVTAVIPPLANAGTDQNVFVEDVVTLDGTGSSTGNPGPLTYAWTQTGGASVTLSDATAAQPTFTAPSAADTITFDLVVTDSLASSLADSVTINVADYAAPTANAGTDQNVNVEDEVTLDGSGSSTTSPGTLTYAWTQTGGASVTLSDATAAMPTFTAPSDADTLTFELVVDDGFNSSTADSVTVEVAEYDAPLADAGPDQNVVVDDVVTLDGTASSTTSPGTLTYAWTQTGGPSVTLSDDEAAQPTFTAPGGPAALTFELVVDDGFSSSTADEVTITVDNTAPVADAGPDQSNKLVDDLVTLDGTDSSDADGTTVTYAWTQTGGPAVTLSDNTAAQPTFTAPAGPSVLTFDLVVDDGTVPSAADSVTISVDNSDPVANAGPNQSVLTNTLVTLDSSGSNDADGHTLSHSWIQTGGTAVVLSGANTTAPTFTPTAVDTYTFEVTVDDGNGGTDTDSVSVSVTLTPVLNDVLVKTTGAINPHKASSTFKVKVQNKSTPVFHATSDNVTVEATVNGVAVDPGQLTLASFDTNLIKNAYVQPTLVWAHTNSALNIGDDIVVTACYVSYGDPIESNNCSSVSLHITDINLDTTSQVIATTAKTSVLKTKFKIGVYNAATQKANPFRTSNLDVTATLNGNPFPVAINPPAALPSPIVAGATKYFTFTSATHAKFLVGDEITVTSCVVGIPGNTAPDPCSTSAIQVVTP